MDKFQRHVTAAKHQREELQERSVLEAAAGCAAHGVDPDSRSPVPFRLMRDVRMGFAIAFTGIVIAMLAWTFGLKNQARTINAAADTAAKEARSAIFALNAQNDKLVRLQARVNLLDDSITRMDDHLADMQGQLNAISTSTDWTAIGISGTATEVLTAHEAPVAATEKENRPAAASDTTPDLAATGGGSPAERKSVATAEGTHASVDASNLASDEGASEVLSAEQTSTGTRADGRWLINLASFADKRDADRFAKRAQSRNVDVDQNQVTVKGRSYWRVQVTGFPSAAEARAHASLVEAKLGLKETWITRR
jgi:cell division septation protein DedD